MKGEFFKGDVKEVCNELKEELERCGNMPVYKWLALRNLEKIEAEQFGIDVKNFRKKYKNIKKHYKNI